jgi:hypothetical protein
MASSTAKKPPFTSNKTRVSSSHPSAKARVLSSMVTLSHRKRGPIYRASIHARRKSSRSMVTLCVAHVLKRKRAVKAHAHQREDTHLPPTSSISNAMESLAKDNILIKSPHHLGFSPGVKQAITRSRTAASCHFLSMFLISRLQTNGRSTRSIRMETLVQMMRERRRVTWPPYELDHTQLNPVRAIRIRARHALDFVEHLNEATLSPLIRPVRPVKKKMK